MHRVFPEVGDCPVGEGGTAYGVEERSRVEWDEDIVYVFLKPCKRHLYICYLCSKEKRASVVLYDIDRWHCKGVGYPDHCDGDRDIETKKWHEEKYGSHLHRHRNKRDKKS